MISLKVIVCAIAVGLTACCVMNKLEKSPQTIRLKPVNAGMPVTITVTRGPHWSQRMQAGPFIFNILPQIVIWTETPEGRLRETVYITGADGKKFNHSEKEKKGAAFYEECFPVWASRMRECGSPLPSKENPYTDAVTSATPTTDFSLHSQIPYATGQFVIVLEINKSGDVNDTFTKSNNDWAGQPSLVYKTIVAPGEKGPFTMTLAGHGGRLRDKKGLSPDTAGFTSALGQVESIVVSFE